MRDVNQQVNHLILNNKIYVYLQSQVSHNYAIDFSLFFHVQFTIFLLQLDTFDFTK